MELHSLKSIYRTSIFNRILHYNSNINPKINRIPLNSLLYCPKTIHISHTYTELILKTQIRLNPNSSKIAHFPIKNYHNLHFATTPKNQFFPTIPQTYFASKFRTTFNLIEVFTDDKPDIYSTIIQNSTNHIATPQKAILVI